MYKEKMVTIDNLLKIRKELSSAFGEPVKRIEFNPRDYETIRKIFTELFPTEIVQRYKIDDKKFRDRFEPYVLFTGGIKLVENKEVERKYMRIVY